MTEESPRYRIEHRRPGVPAVVLAETDGIVRALAVAGAHARRLHKAGEAGSLAVVNARHGYDVLVRAVRMGWGLDVED